MSTNLPISIGIPLVAGIGMGLITPTSVDTWYKDLDKPDLRPPNWVFGPVWTALDTAMGYGGHHIANHPPMLLTQRPEIWVKLAALDCALLTVNIAAMIGTWCKVDGRAAQLMTPYLGWSTFATYLTISIYHKNFSGRARKEQ
ncbi:hypothetical protein Unana1_01540 [Umbelopsis nana]